MGPGKYVQDEQTNGIVPNAPKVEPIVEAAAPRVSPLSEEQRLGIELELALMGQWLSLLPIVAGKLEPGILSANYKTSYWRG